MTKVTIAGLEAIHIGCNLGHTIPPDHLWDKDGFGYYRCPTCHLVWVSPQLTDVSVAHIYQQMFKGKLQAYPRPTSFLPYRARLRNLHLYKKYGRLLDVGCFSGNFLLAAQADGWEHPEGTEISTLAVQYARSEYGFNVHEGDLLTLDLPSDFYDAITLSDVIEHVSDPLKTIQRIYTLLRPGGVLYMDTPHFNSFPRWILGKEWNVFFPWHRTYFSASNMKTALVMAGFHVKKVSAVGVLPFSRFNAWKAYKADTPAPSKTVAANTVIQANKGKLQPLWLGFKRSTEIPFELLSLMNIHIGAKLIVYAEKL
jgi:SAM-dependent methyltransferase